MLIKGRQSVNKGKAECKRRKGKVLTKVKFKAGKCMTGEVKCRPRKDSAQAVYAG